jgi:hypothetical protein
LPVTTFTGGAHLADILATLPTNGYAGMVTLESGWQQLRRTN